jgi:hypothetical protein
MERKKFIKTLGIGALGFAIVPAAIAGVSGKKSDYDMCKLVWEELCGKIGKSYKTDCFKYVHPVKKKPNVLLYGDSISILYTSQVRKSLKDQATVFRLFKNGGSSKQFIPNMNTMNEAMFQPYLKNGWKFEWDLVHFNVGLHDLKFLKGKHLNKKGSQVSSIIEYKERLDEICKYLKLKYPKAKLIFATTTAVPEGSKGRFVGDSMKYNKAAIEVLAGHPDIIINDLYGFTFPNRQKWHKKPGDVHYNALGANEQGKEVARIIADNLQLINI